jgi:anti-anti-sigma factor
VVTDASSEKCRPSSFNLPGDPGFCIRVSEGARGRVVEVIGELDQSNRHLLHDACLGSVDVDVVVDLGDLTFMDCCGYAGFVSVGRALQDRGCSLALGNLKGQPARLLGLIDALAANRVERARPDRT